MRIGNAVCFVLLGTLMVPSVAALPMARGVVFVDTNKNQIYDSGETGLPGVCVSNGVDVVQSDANGAWALSVGDDTGIFLIKPAHYQVPLSQEKIPAHYYLHKPQGSPTLEVAGVAPTGPLPKAINFPLYPHPEDKDFTGLFFGDTQARGLREVNFVSHDVVEECLNLDVDFGVSLGDIVADDPSLFAELSESIAQIGVPWYNIFGNHDNNRDRRGNRSADDTFERFFGPSTYAYSYGEVVFIALNNIYFPSDKKGYVSRFTEDQLAFVENYLDTVPHDKLVVLLMHVPIVACKNREAMFRLIEDRPHTLTVAAHLHEQRHLFLDKSQGWRGKEPHHLFINATVSGSWWCGTFDERGIPHATMNDGAPNGYSLITFRGNQYSIKFKAASRPADYQMNIYLPDDIPLNNLMETEVLVNVFAGSERSVVSMRIDGTSAWVPLEQTTTIDPQCLRMHEQNPYLDEKVFGWKMDYPSKTSHMWKGRLPKEIAPGTHVVTVRSTDMFGQSHESNRIFRIRP